MTNSIFEKSGLASKKGDASSSFAIFCIPSALFVQLKGVSCCVFSEQEHRSRLQLLSFYPSCDADLPRLVLQPTYAGSCYETALGCCPMQSDLPAPGATRPSRMICSPLHGHAKRAAKWQRCTSTASSKTAFERLVARVCSQRQGERSCYQGHVVWSEACSVYFR